ncbi:hypothetical protein V6U81_07545 [Micromonospora sp. CPCC 205711]
MADGYLTADRRLVGAGLPELLSAELRQVKALLNALFALSCRVW